MNRVWCVDSPGWGGSEINLCRVWRLLESRHETALLNQTHAPELKRACEERQQQCLVAPTFNSARHAVASLLRASRFAKQFAQQLFVVWCHHSDSNRWLQVALATQRRSFVLVEQLVPTSRAAFQNSRLSLPIKRFVAARARAVVLNGHSQRRHYMDLFGLPQAPVQVIAASRPVNDIFERVRRLKADRQTLRHNLGLPSAPTVLCVARLCAQKNQATLVRAVAQVARSIPEVQLLLVGEGPDEQALRNQAQALLPGKVTFAGHQPDPLPWLAAADLFVLPSLAEGLPGVLIEAMAAGLPCVASDIPGNKELVRHAQTGLAFPVGDEACLATHIGSLLRHPVQAETYAQAALELVRRDYDEPLERAAWQALLGPTSPEPPIRLTPADRPSAMTSKSH